MNAEETVKLQFPNAFVQKYEPRIFGYPYFLVWSKFNGTRLSNGKTKDEAWKNAKRNMSN